MFLYLNLKGLFHLQYQSDTEQEKLYPTLSKPKIIDTFKLVKQFEVPNFEAFG